MTSKATAGLRANAFAALVMFLAEFCLGTSLYGAVPESDHGRGLFAAFGAAIVSGPIFLTLHAVLGTLLVISTASLLVRAVAARAVPHVVISAVTVAATMTAWAAGSSVVNADSATAGLVMQLATAVALLCCALLLFLLPRPVVRLSDHDQRRSARQSTNQSA